MKWLHAVCRLRGRLNVILINQQHHCFNSFGAEVARNRRSGLSANVNYSRPLMGCSLHYAVCRQKSPRRYILNLSSTVEIKSALRKKYSALKELSPVSTKSNARKNRHRARLLSLRFGRCVACVSCVRCVFAYTFLASPA